MATRGNPSLTTRAPEDVHQRVEAAAARAGVSKAAWLLEAITMVLEEDEAFTAGKPAPERPGRHVPAAIAAATPRRAANGTMLMPAGRVFYRR